MTPLVASEWFAAGNLAFLAVDILLAHASNDFAHRAEWIPIGFSLAVTLILLPGLLRARWRWRAAGLGVGIAAVVVGVAGLVYHLESGFFAEQTLHRLVYAAPFVAPLAYTGVGLLLLLNRLEPSDAPAWGSWVVFLALGGFVGNLGLSLLDHAQNGFYSPAEWIPVGAAAFAVSFLATALARPARPFLRLCLGLCALQALVGVAGLLLHVAADLHRPAPGLLQQVLYGAPPFAPLLFADLAALAAIGLWAMLRVRPEAAAGPS